MENDLVFIIDQAGRYYGTPYIEGQPNIHSVYYKTLCDMALEQDQYRKWAVLLRQRIETIDDSLTIPNMASKLGLITGWTLYLEPDPEDQVSLAIFPKVPRREQLMQMENTLKKRERGLNFYFRGPDEGKTLMYGRAITGNTIMSFIDSIKQDLINEKRNH